MPKIQNNISLRNYSNFKIGGFADYFCTVESKEEIVEVIKEWRQISKDFSPDKQRIYILGEGTNILFSDEGFSGLVIKNSINFIFKNGNNIEVGAGTLFSDVLNFCIKEQLSGLEWAGGLPGTIGGAARGNAGAYNGETKDKIIEIESIDAKNLQVKTRNNKECNFGYRKSIFKNDAIDEIIIKVKFSLAKGNKANIIEEIEKKTNARKLRHPLEYPNIGSIFQNVPVEKFDQKNMESLSQYTKMDPFPVIPSAKLNFLAGLSGKRVGGAQLSEKHTNFIINLGSAKAEDVKKLMKIIEGEIKNKFNVDLIPEVMFVD